MPAVPAVFLAVVGMGSGSTNTAKYWFSTPAKRMGGSVFSIGSALASAIS